MRGLEWIGLQSRAVRPRQTRHMTRPLSTGSDRLMIILFVGSTDPQSPVQQECPVFPCSTS